MEDDPGILVLIVDVNPLVWGARGTGAAAGGAAADAKVPAPHDGVERLSFAGAMDQLLVFVSAYQLLHRRNKLCVIASSPYASRFVYPPPPPPQQQPPSQALANGAPASAAAGTAPAAADAKQPAPMVVDSASTPAAAANGSANGNATASAAAAGGADPLKLTLKLPLRKPAAAAGAPAATTGGGATEPTAAASAADSDGWAAVAPLISAGLSRCAADAAEKAAHAQAAAPTGSGASAPGILLSGAMSLALCYLNRLRSQSMAVTPVQARVLVVTASPDVSAQYVSVMNCIFTAQKANVAVDACILAESHSLLLQQACHLTNGVYFLAPRAHGFVQHLMMLFLAPQSLRSALVLPGAATQAVVDFRAACFCHRNAIDQGNVCPVCLSIFCITAKPATRCATCGTRFAAAPPAALAAGAVRAPTPAAATPVSARTPATPAAAAKG